LAGRAADIVAVAAVEVVVEIAAEGLVVDYYIATFDYSVAETD
jgi:hypothetical protein